MINLKKIEYQMHNAVAFYETGREKMDFSMSVEKEQKSEKNSYLAVAATNIHFAVELALKALAEMTVQNFVAKDYGHDLSALFGTLSPTRQSDITREYDYKISNTNYSSLYGITRSSKDKVDNALNEYKSDLLSVLEVHKMGFRDWRYTPYGINSAVLFFDYHALVCLFKSLQNHIGFIMIELKKTRNSKFELVDKAQGSSFAVA